MKNRKKFHQPIPKMINCEIMNFLFYEYNYELGPKYATCWAFALKLRFTTKAF